jgi:hypothetical protein
MAHTQVFGREDSGVGEKFQQWVTGHKKRPLYYTTGTFGRQKNRHNQ